MPGNREVKFPPAGKAVAGLLCEACGRERLGVALTHRPGLGRGSCLRALPLRAGRDPLRFLLGGAGKSTDFTGEGKGWTRPGGSQQGRPSGETGAQQGQSAQSACGHPMGLTTCHSAQGPSVCPGPLPASRSCRGLCVLYPLVSRTGHVSRGFEWFSHPPLS